MKFSVSRNHAWLVSSVVYKVQCSAVSVSVDPAVLSGWIFPTYWAVPPTQHMLGKQFKQSAWNKTMVVVVVVVGVKYWGKVPRMMDLHKNWTGQSGSSVVAEVLRTHKETYLQSHFLQMVVRREFNWRRIVVDFTYKHLQAIMNWATNILYFKIENKLNWIYIRVFY